MNWSQKEINVEQLLVMKEETFPSLISSLGECCDVPKIIENINLACKFLPVLELLELEEELLKHVMPKAAEAIKQLFADNNLKAQNNVLNVVKYNLQLALSLLDDCSKILEHVIKCECTEFHQVQSLPLNTAHIIISTFEHCKSSQKTYHPSLQSITEIVELFKKTQEIHAKYLTFIDSHLQFDYDNDNDVATIRDLLNLILEMSKILSGVNIKSMADSWKSFTSLIQKHSKILSFFDFSPPFKCLIFEIKHQIKNVFLSHPSDTKKAVQSIKIAGFLVKVTLKLIELCPDIVKIYFEDILTFCLIIYSYPCGRFSTNRFPDEFITIVNDSFFRTTEPFVTELLRQPVFLKKICNLEETSLIVNENSFGFLSFSNEILKQLPVIAGLAEMRDFGFADFLSLIFYCTKICYKEFFWDYNSAFYEDFTTNISVAVLIFPEEFEKVEGILFESVAQEKIWTALVAIDSWTSVLRVNNFYSTKIEQQLELEEIIPLLYINYFAICTVTDIQCQVSRCCPEVATSTLNTLLTKILEFNLGKFTQPPCMIFIKILARRIFKILPNSSSNALISKYSPKKNMRVWKILDLKLIPLSQRFQIENVLGDLFDKIGVIENENSSINEVLDVTETFDTVASINFNNLQINTSRLTPFVNRLWSHTVPEMFDNNFYKYFILKLTKITITIIDKLVPENLVLILSRLKSVLNEPLFKLLVCCLLQAISKRNWCQFQDKQMLYDLITDHLFQMLLNNNSNPVVTQTALDTINKLQKNENFRPIINKLTSNSSVKKLFVIYTQTQEPIDWTIHEEYLESVKDSKYQHRCLEWTELNEPLCKRMKFEDVDIDVFIGELQSNSQKLAQARVKLSARQAANLKGVIGKLELLLL